MNDLPHSPAAERNRQPILDVLRQVLPASGTALEIASGTGQHVTWFAAGLLHWIWRPTDCQTAELAAIAARVAQERLTNVRPPVLLDVMAPQWLADGPAHEDKRFDLIYCANMLHIAPWATCAALMQGSARCLTPGGQLVTYGPYLEENVPTSPGNVSFDQSLRAQNPVWGIRKREDVETEAARAGLQLSARHIMPTNNLLLVWTRTG